MASGLAAGCDNGTTGGGTVYSGADSSGTNYTLEITGNVYRLTVFDFSPAASNIKYRNRRIRFRERDIYVSVRLCRRRIFYHNGKAV
jgi:hypothetical protein